MAGQTSAKSAQPGRGAGRIYDFVGGGHNVGPETLMVGPQKDAGELSSRRASQGLMRYWLEVEITSARGLRNADWMPLVGGTSDPYCICQVKGAGKTKFRSKTVDNCTEPVWKETCSIDDFYDGDVLLFSVFDEDTGKDDDFLGQVELPTCSVVPDGFEGDLRLQRTSYDGSDSVEAYLTVRVAVSDSRHESNPPARPEAPLLLRVAIKAAAALRRADWAPGTGTSDPYVTCQLQAADGKKIAGDKASLRTPTVKNSIQPDWDFAGSLLVPKGASLLFEVWDEDLGGMDDFLGRAVVRCEQLASGSFKEDLVLQESQTGMKATLSVRVASAQNEVERLKRLGAQQEKLGFHDQAEKGYFLVDEILKDSNGYLSAEGIENLQALARIAKHHMAFDKSLSHLQEARRLSRQLCRAERPAFARLLAEIGSLHFALRDFSNADQAYDESEQLLRRLGAAESEHRAAVLTGRAGLELARQRPKAALQSFEKAVELRSRSGALRSVEGAALITNRGTAKFSAGDFVGAIQDFKQARALLERLGAWPTEDGIELLRNLGLALRKKGDLLEAAAAFQEARKLREQLGTLATPAGARLLTNLGVALASMGRYQNALEACEEAWRVLEACGTLDSPEGAALLLNIGCFREMLGDYTGALAVLEGAGEIRSRTGTAESVEAAELQRAMGSVCLAQGEAEKALRHFEKSLKLREKLGLLRTAGGGELFRNIGLARGHRAELAEATKAFDQAIDICYESRSLSKSLGALLMTNIGSLQRRKKEDEKALEALQEAKKIFVQLDLAGSVEGMLLQDSLKQVEKERLQKQGQSLQEYEQAESRAAQEALDQSAKTHREELLRKSVELETRGRRKMASSDWDAAVKDLQQAVDLRSKAENTQARDGLEAARTLAALGSALRGARRDEEALEVNLKSLDAFQRVGCLESPEGVTLLKNLAPLRSEQGDLQGELRDLRQALDIETKLGTSQSSEGLSTRRSLAAAHERAGEPDRALEVLQDLQQFYEKNDVHAARVREVDEAIFKLQASVANATPSTNRDQSPPSVHRNADPATAQALAELESQRKDHEEKGTLQSAQGAHVLMSLGASHGRMGNFEAAMQSFGAAREAYKRLGLTETEEGVALLCNMGYAVLKAGQAGQALALYEEAKKICEKRDLLQQPAGQRALRGLEKAKLTMQH